MKAIRIYIVEEEVIMQEPLHLCLEQLGYEVCGLATEAKQAWHEIVELKPDLVFIDLDIKGENSGIWLGERLDIPFIYLTANNDTKTIDAALQTKPCNCLIRPFNWTQIYAAVSLAVKPASEPNDSDTDKEIRHSQNDYNVKGELVMRDGSTYFKVNLNNILFVHTEGKYIYLHTAEKKIILRTSLSFFLEDNKYHLFERVHKSYVVNIDKISSFSNDHIMIATHRIPLSRSYKNSFFERMEVFRAN